MEHEHSPENGSDIYPDSQRGVTDWKFKQEVVKRVLGVYTSGEIPEKVYERLQVQKTSKELKAIADSARRWESHTPLLHRAFFDDLARALRCPEHVQGLDIIKSSLNEFIQYLPPESQEKAHRALGEHAISVSDRSSNHGHRHMRVNVRGAFESLVSGVRAGHLDTRHYYSTAEAAGAWRQLVSADAYPTYDQCKAGLRRLTEDPQWEAAVAAVLPTTLVMLAGGGSPTKDLVLLRSLLQNTPPSHRITLVIVDIAMYMLHHSMDLLEEALHDEPGHERVQLEYVTDDVLNLGDHPVFRRRGPAVFAITGGTIGNLRELKFFQSLSRVARDGDLLIVSADTVDGMSKDAMQRVLTKKYDHADVRRFIEPGVRAVVAEYNPREPIESALKRVEVRLIENASPRLSDVPKTTCVTLVLNNGRKDVILASSTRYSVDAFTAFTSRQGWQSAATVTSPLNPHFVQMLFRRKAGEHGGTV